MHSIDVQISTASKSGKVLYWAGMLHNFTFWYSRCAASDNIHCPIACCNKSSPKSFGKSASLLHKVPLVTVGCPKFTPKLLLPLRWSTPHLMHLPSTDPTHHPKWHPDPISRFATVHFPGWQTDQPTHTQTDRWARRQVTMTGAYACYIDKEWHANNVFFVNLAVEYPGFCYREEEGGTKWGVCGWKSLFSPGADTLRVLAAKPLEL